MTRVDSPVPLMHNDSDRSWITNPDTDHPKGTQPKCCPGGQILRNCWKDPDMIGLWKPLGGLPYDKGRGSHRTFWRLKKRFWCLYGVQSQKVHRGSCSVPFRVLSRDNKLI